ncbi:MAG: molecular chaperone DnaK (HSP70), partial [Oleiphilaceae bacterium]
MSQAIEARYSVGIDLGTTHCVLSYLDNRQAAEDTSAALEILVLPIPQLTQPGVVEERKQLPSF